MKTYILSKTQSFSAIVLAIMGLFLLTPDSNARDRHSSHHHHRYPSWHSSSSRHYTPQYYDRRQALRELTVSVQYALARRGYYHGNIDGVMGSMAQRAVRNYQRDHRLAVTGNINNDVLRSLGLR